MIVFVRYPPPSLALCAGRIGEVLKTEWQLGPYRVNLQKGTDLGVSPGLRPVRVSYTAVHHGLGFELPR